MEESGLLFKKIVNEIFPKLKKNNNNKGGGEDMPKLLKGVVAKLYFLTRLILTMSILHLPGFNKHVARTLYNVR